MPSVVNKIKDALTPGSKSHASDTGRMDDTGRALDQDYDRNMRTVGPYSDDTGLQKGGPVGGGTYSTTDTRRGTDVYSNRTDDRALDRDGDGVRDTNRGIGGVTSTGMGTGMGTGLGATGVPGDRDGDGIRDTMTTGEKIKSMIPGTEENKEKKAMQGTGMGTTGMGTTGTGLGAAGVGAPLGGTAINRTGSSSSSSSSSSDEDVVVAGGRGRVCDQKTFREVEDRPIVRERVEKIIEHRPVEKHFETTVRPVGERVLEESIRFESLGVQEHIIERVPGSPCPAGTGHATAGMGVGDKIKSAIPGTAEHRATHPTHGMGTGAGYGTTTGMTTGDKIKAAIPGTQEHKMTHPPTAGTVGGPMSGTGVNTTGMGTGGHIKANIPGTPEYAATHGNPPVSGMGNVDAPRNNRVI